MFHDPIEQGFFKADVFASFFAFDPLMLQDFLTLGDELLVEHGVLNEPGLILLDSGHLATVFHKIDEWSIKSE
jgi:hypothetical protein